MEGVLKLDITYYIMTYIFKNTRYIVYVVDFFWVSRQTHRLAPTNQQFE
jgi:hypothetical protein